MAALLYLVVFLLAPFLSYGADPDPLQDICVADLDKSPSFTHFPCKPASKVVSDDFFFTGLRREGNTSNDLGVGVTPGNVFSFPGVNMLGISMNRVDLRPGGLNPPHTHPRATESGVVIKGTVLVGFVTTDNVFYSKVLLPGHMFVVPRGLMHFQKNVGKKNAIIITAFNSQNPGAVQLPVNLFGTKPPIPDHVLTQTFGVDRDVVNSIGSKY